MVQLLRFHCTARIYRAEKDNYPFVSVARPAIQRNNIRRNDPFSCRASFPILGRRFVKVDTLDTRFTRRNSQGRASVRLLSRPREKADCIPGLCTVFPARKSASPGAACSRWQGGFAEKKQRPHPFPPDGFIPDLELNY